MSIEDLKQNVENEKKIVENMVAMDEEMIDAGISEREFYNSSLEAFAKQVKILNDSKVRLRKLGE